MGLYEACEICGAYGHKTPECSQSPCRICGNWGHKEETCPMDPGLPEVTVVGIEGSVTVHPTPEEQMVTILSGIKIDMKRILEELKTIKRKIR